MPLRRVSKRPLMRRAIKRRGVVARPSRRLAPRRRYIYGRGAYYVQGSLGGRAKIPGIGSVNADIAAGYASRGAYLSGKGAYSVHNIRKNSLLAMGDPPVVRNSRTQEGATVIRHREYLGLVTSSAIANTFKIDTYPLNPAQSVSFPWLSALAQNYEEYQPNGVVYEFKSTCSDAIASSTNLALGQIMMATQYDPLDSPFADDISMLNYEYAQSCKVSESACHFVECDYKQSPIIRLYTRPGAPSDSADLRFSDFGNFSIASTGLQGTSVVLGQLWVSYEFLCFKPKVNDIGNQAGNIWKMKNTVVTQSTPLGNVTGNEVDDFSTLDIINTSNSIILPKTTEPSSYLIIVSHNTNLAAVVYNTFAPTVTNGVLMKQWNNDTFGYFNAPSGGATTGSDSMIVIVSVEAAKNAIFSMSASTTNYTPAGTFVDVTVMSIPYVDPNVWPHL